MSTRLRYAVAIPLALAACLDDLELETKTFACRSAEDCVDGFVCDPTRFVCVTNSADGGAPDGAIGPGFGQACVDESCREGSCVDGVCCRTPCTEACHRCDLVAGTCTPSQDGTDPDGDCAVSIDCGTVVCELLGDLCYACVEGPSTATCDGAGGCRANACLGTGRGRLLGGCHGGCARAGACAPGSLATANDDPLELCASGGACLLQSGQEACCSQAGTCCPMCDADDPLCE
ncbi:MAG: hypothetical protein HY791_13730 [Deltaproteobacteria bacterium]|nr:hypothetical protein [Deltaproteobacteria bacterium]